MLEQLEQLAAQDERREQRRQRRAPRQEPAPVAPESPRTDERALALPSPAQTERERRSAAARRGWEKRRRTALERERQTWHINPERAEDGGKETGDGVYVLYEAAHPLRGNPDVRSEWDARLRDYYGHRVRISLNGYYVDPDSGEPSGRVYFVSVEDISRYSDFFGPDSAYMRLAKRVRNSSSESELIVTSLSVELADDLPSTADAARERTKKKAERRKAKRAARKKPRGK